MYLAWSFNALFDGRAGTGDPAGNHYGKSGTIAGGARCILWQAPADCEHLSIEYGLPNYNALKPCMRCCCDRDACPWDDWSDHAKFLQTAYQPSDLLKAPLTRHWLLTIKGTSHFIFSYDLMHCGDIGFGGRAIANCFYDFLYKDPEFAGTKSQKCQQIMARISKKYKDLGVDDCKIQKLLLQYFLPDKQAPHQHAPDLMHSAVKAKQTNRLVHVVASIVADLPRTTTYQKHRFHCMKSLSNLNSTISRNGMFLPRSEADEFKQYSYRFLKHYDVLSKLSLKLQEGVGAKQWHQTPKFHFLVRIVEDAYFLNPKAVWCYPGEHMVGNVTRLAQSCLAGTAAHKVPAALCKKYQIGKHLIIKATLG